MSSYELIDSTFIIRDYDKKAPFSSFLPGLAGVTGIPMWSFYTNRGQGICSFGIHHKGNAMMEFNSANTGYENTQVRGFRTLMRIDGTYYEPFFHADEEDADRRMKIEKNVLTVQEEHRGVRVKITYFILPNENIGALVRNVTIENKTGRKITLEMLDGMPQVIPYGIQNGQYKEMSNLFKSWSDIRNIENNAPIYKMRASSDDVAEVKEITGGWFYTCIHEGHALPIVYDKAAVFSFDQSMMDPIIFRKKGLQAVENTAQVFANKVPCAFSPVTASLETDEAVTLTAYMGYAVSEEFLNEKLMEFCAPGYAERKLEEARETAEQFTKDVKTSTADPLLDAYIQQCYMDNFLRGGYPFAFGSGCAKKILHLFSRKHGDPERDYNFFSIAGEFFSQGNGNYRDVCQNRRLDCSLHPEIGDYNIVNFFSLVQMDGYNPLEIRPSTFVLKAGEDDRADAVLRQYLDTGTEEIKKILRVPFTPGMITNALFEARLSLRGTPEAFIQDILSLCEQRFEAAFGEGYWSDHWDYNLDLVEDYLSVWPDKKDELLYKKSDYRYFDSPVVVRPRSETYVLNHGHVRQYGSLRPSEKKLSQKGYDPKQTNWLKDASSNILHTTLFEKMLTLAVNKFALLDSQQLGVEMEGGKPGWNDAMNGLPGLLGSSMPETLELRRLLLFLKQAIQEKEPQDTLSLFAEPVAFLRSVYAAHLEESDRFARWDRVAALRESFRAQIEAGVSGKTECVAFGELSRVMALFADTLEDSVRRALKIGRGIMPTFFSYEASEYEPRLNDDGTPWLTPYGMPGVIVKALDRKDYPLFLEGPARFLASCGKSDREKAVEMSRKIRESDLFDPKLKMYKTSESIEGCDMEIGRVRAFTPGWLERESVFLHMEYKYLLGLMKAGLYDAFYQAADTALIPHLDPAIYGRSILENSSFLASSVNPDPETHGRGFVGRLSGSTVEMLSIWKMMFVGNGGFEQNEGAVCYRFAPLLRGNLFDERGEASFTLCGGCQVVYHNTNKKNTFGENGAKAVRIRVDDGIHAKLISGDCLPVSICDAIRARKIKRIDVDLE